MRNLLTKNRSGFTLVELLIVVAILGVLATVGVPAYRQMVQKSKKAEAKVNLGNLSLVESAFFSEFGGYGNNLRGMGFEMEGTAGLMTYLVGFHTNTCADPAQVRPINAPTDAIGSQVALASPNYYNTAPTSRFGRTTVTSCQAPTNVPGCVSGTAPPVPDPNATQADVFSTTAWTATCTANGTGGLWNGFVAMATGCIRQGQNKDTCGVVANMDIWTMNQARVLSNEQDGVN